MDMKRFNLCRQFLLVSLLLALSVEPSWTAPLTVAVEDDAAPWSNSDGSGFANEVVRAAFRVAGVEVNLEVVPYARCKDMAIKGQVAACFSMAWLPEFEGIIVFAEKPIFTGYADYFTRASHPVKAVKESAMEKGTVVGVVTGYEYPLNIHRLKDTGMVVFE